MALKRLCCPTEEEAAAGLGCACCLWLSTRSRDKVQPDTIEGSGEEKTSGKASGKGGKEAAGMVALLGSGKPAAGSEGAETKSNGGKDRNAKSGGTPPVVTTANVGGKPGRAGKLAPLSVPTAAAKGGATVVPISTTAGSTRRSTDRKEEKKGGHSPYSAAAFAAPVTELEEAPLLTRKLERVPSAVLAERSRKLIKTETRFGYAVIL